MRPIGILSSLLLIAFSATGFAQSGSSRASLRETADAQLNDARQKAAIAIRHKGSPTQHQYLFDAIASYEVLRFRWPSDSRATEALFGQIDLFLAISAPRNALELIQDHGPGAARTDELRFILRECSVYVNLRDVAEAERCFSSLLKTRNPNDRRVTVELLGSLTDGAAFFTRVGDARSAARLLHRATELAPSPIPAAALAVAAAESAELSGEGELARSARSLGMARLESVRNRNDLSVEEREAVQRLSAQLTNDQGRGRR